MSFRTGRKPGEEPAVDSARAKRTLLSAAFDVAFAFELKEQAPSSPPWKSGASAPRKASGMEPGFSPGCYRLSEHLARPPLGDGISYSVFDSSPTTAEPKGSNHLVHDLVISS